MSIEMIKFWGSNYYHHPPLTLERLEAAEKELGVKLPPKLIELLQIQNGGYTKGFVFPMTVKTTWAEDHVPLSELFGIVLENRVETPQNIVQSQYMATEWGLPEKQVLLSGDGHWWITLDYRSGFTPIVKWIDVECNEEITIANSFDEFYAGLLDEGEFAHKK